MSRQYFPNTNIKFSVFDIDIDNFTMQESVDIIINSKEGSEKSGALVAFFVNANSLNYAYKSSELKEIINRSDFTFADGCGVRFAAKRKGITIKENINGTDMLPLLCKEACVKGKSIFMLGSAPGIAKEAASKINCSFPKLNIAGHHHGYIDANNSEFIIKKINESGANILLVGMGTPIQETWLDKNSDKLNVDIAIAVGGLFDYYSNRIPRAPLFFRKNSIEWVWRLIQEPKGKFVRYVVGNPIFLFRTSFINLEK